MAVVSPMPVTLQKINSTRHGEIGTFGMMRRTAEIVVEQPPIQVEDKIYVAVGKELKEAKSTLLWALHNSGGRKICILHVHEPAQKIPCMGTTFRESQLEDREVEAYRKIEKQEMDKLLSVYSTVCEGAGVHADIVHTQKDTIQKGIVELISQHGIRRLVMGAAADKHYSKKMMEPKSKKAIYVRLQAPITCHIWFVCKGHLVRTREGRLEGVSGEVASLIRQASQSTELRPSGSPMSPSGTKVQNDQLKRISSVPENRRARLNVHGTNIFAFPPDSSVTPHTTSDTEESFNEWGRISTRSPSLNSYFPSSSAEDRPSDVMDYSKDDHRHTSPSSVLEGRRNDELYDQLEQSMAEAKNSKIEAFEESMKRKKAEKEALDANRRAKTFESLYFEESRQRKETETALASRKEELERMKQQVDEVMKELRIALEQKSSLESVIANAKHMVQELEEKMSSAVGLRQKYKKERDELQVERDDALKVAKELRRKKAEEASNTLMPRFFSEFSLSDIKEATGNFDPSLKIGKGGYGSIYKGLLHHTQVAIKTLNPGSSQGPSEFQQEVNILSKLRHPNLITLVGACPEASILVYEYLPNQSLEDRLSCKDNTPPLSWQTRIRIAAELCSVLIFLHTGSPSIIVHGDLKPANILLDANDMSKLSDFGISRVILRNGFSSSDTTMCCITNPKGTPAYMDPEFLSLGELTAMSDVYSFGIILLRLLTGKPAKGIAKEVQYALDKGNLKDLLDPTAGNWPSVQAEKLIHLAMRCCERDRSNRPDLASEVWSELEPMRELCGTSSFGMRSDEHFQIPPYFICPISQKIMQDPHVAADGLTYELEAFRGWLDRGHDTSPVTKFKLPHFQLVPNHALCAAIHEWLQRP